MTESGQEQSASAPADRVGDGMKLRGGHRRIPEPCLHPGCTKNDGTGARGFCYWHYQEAYRLVHAGQTTWEKLELCGRARPRIRPLPIIKGDGTPDQ